jgi:hypothetical protein
VLCEAAAPYKISWDQGQRGGVRRLGEPCAGAEADALGVGRAEGGGAADEVLLEEVLALRTILLNLDVLADERKSADTGGDAW